MPTDTGATNVSGAAARLSNLMQVEPQEPTTAEVEAQEAPAVEHDATPETTEEVQETQEAQANSDTESTPEEVDGIDEVEQERGYLRDKDYREKTMALADERKNVESKGAELDKYLTEVQELINDEMTYLDSQEMHDLKVDDPEMYLKEMDKAQAKMRKYEEIRATRTEAQKAREAEMLKNEQEALYSAFPEWKDNAEKMKADGAKLMKTLSEELNFSQDELANLSDHRWFVMADKLNKLNSILNANPSDKAVKPKPKSVKPGSATTKEDRVSSDVKSMRDKFKKSGNIRDAVKLLQM